MSETSLWNMYGAGFLGRRHHHFSLGIVGQTEMVDQGFGCGGDFPIEFFRISRWLHVVIS